MASPALYKLSQRLTTFRPDSRRRPRGPLVIRMHAKRRSALAKNARLQHQNRCHRAVGPVAFPAIRFGLGRRVECGLVRDGPRCRARRREGGPLPRQVRPGRCPRPAPGRRAGDTPDCDLCWTRRPAATNWRSSTWLMVVVVVVVGRQSWFSRATPFLPGRGGCADLEESSGGTCERRVCGRGQGLYGVVTVSGT